jgi:hypothetical protein
MAATLFYAGGAFGADDIRFSTEGNPRANGLVFSVTFPAGYEVVEAPPNGSQVVVAYTNEPEFPTVMALAVAPVPVTDPPFSFNDFKDGDVTRWVTQSFTPPGGETPRVLSKGKTSHQGHYAIKGDALVNQELLGETQPSIEQLLFIQYQNSTITAVCSTFNSQRNPNILLHFHGRGGFDPCNKFFNGINLP